MATQVEIAGHVGVNVSTVNKILHNKGTHVFSKETIQRVLRTARRLGFEFHARKHHRQRGSQRKFLALAARVTVYLKDGSVFDEGLAKITELSERGALLTELALPKKSILTEPF